MSPPSEPIILTGIGTDAVNTFEDLSGTTDKSNFKTSPELTLIDPKSINPYDALIENCDNDPAKIYNAYQTHRHTRNANQRARLLADDFPGITIDPILRELEYVKGNAAATASLGDPPPPKRSEDEIDPRNCIVFWARPTTAVMDLIGSVQEKLKAFAPDLWLMPRPNLHLTVLEITHSTTAAYTSSLLSQLKPQLPSLLSHPSTHRAHLIKPLLSFDAAALAISFAPTETNAYTYHHLRRDFYQLSRDAGVSVTSRYMVPSAHITVARFVSDGDFRKEGGEVDRAKMKGWMELVGKINEELEGWEGEWVVGAERGVECRVGTLWYGGGETIETGRAF